MKNKSTIYMLAGAATSITVYLLVRLLAAGKKRIDLHKEEEALKEKLRKKFAHEYGEYTL